MGKKIIDIKTRRNASRGRKSKAGGGKKSKATQEYTPLYLNSHDLEKKFILIMSYKLSIEQIKKGSDVWLKKSTNKACFTESKIAQSML